MSTPLSEEAIAKLGEVLTTVREEGTPFLQVIEEEIRQAEEEILAPLRELKEKALHLFHEVASAVETAVETTTTAIETATPEEVPAEVAEPASEAVDMPSEVVEPAEEAAVAPEATPAEVPVG